MATASWSLSRLHDNVSRHECSDELKNKFEKHEFEEHTQNNNRLHKPQKSSGLTFRSHNVSLFFVVIIFFFEGVKVVRKFLDGRTPPYFSKLLMSTCVGSGP